VPKATVGKDWSFDFATLLTSENAPAGSTVAWSSSGAPAWLTLSTTAGTAAGRPTEAGTVSLDVVAKQAGLEAKKTFEIVVEGVRLEVSKVASGDLHTCAVNAEGKVLCWGYNAQGQLGNASGTSSAKPVEVAGLTGVAAISAGAYHTCALTTSKTVTCWGSNEHGQLGRSANSGTGNANPTPSVVAGLSNVTHLSAGGSSTCAVVAGVVSCWGTNYYGQLGNANRIGTQTPTPVPVAVAGISGATVVTTGNAHTCAVLTGGAVSCWGNNYYAQLGNTSSNGSNAGNSNPTTVSGITGATSLALGSVHTCATVSGGGVSCWGYNVYGQLGKAAGSGTQAPNPSPAAINGLSGVLGITAGGNHTCALLSDGTVSCWGLNHRGQVGNATNSGNTGANPAPTAVAGIAGASAVSAGNRHTCVLGQGGATSCWGDNQYGQIGRAAGFGTSAANPAPAPVDTP
jgi:alpha-tubulin suppressor-like RCC1 family protein